MQEELAALDNDDGDTEGDGGASTGGALGLQQSIAKKKEKKKRRDKRRTGGADAAAIAFGEFDFTPIQWQAFVVTGRRLGAGTDAKASIELQGEYGHSGFLPLTKTASGGQAEAPQQQQVIFERGQEDKFIFEWPELGNLRKITLKHDNSGMTPGW